ncbi:MAG: aminoacyl-tRNA hydrolase [Patescibacteria group bacterium]
MKLIIGLGNPGRQYQKTRHNFGWLVLDQLAGKGEWKENKRLPGLYYEIELAGQEIMLVKPTTFMNNSGQTFLFLKKKNPRLKLSDLIIIHDDKDLIFEQIKISKDASAAGHNGVKSIITALGSQDFIRVRLGIKNELAAKIPADQFVLERFSASEKKELTGVIIEAAEAVKVIIEQGYQEAMSQFN